MLLLQLLNYFCLSSRWRRRWGRRQIPRRGPPSALDVPIPLSRGPLPPPASLPGTSHGQLSPEPPLEENTLWPRENCTHRWLWLITQTFFDPKSISSESYFTTHFVAFPVTVPFFNSTQQNTKKLQKNWVNKKRSQYACFLSWNTFDTTLMLYPA